MRGGDGVPARELAHNARLAVAGDFNIAPEDRDVHDPALWAGQVLCSGPERAVFHGWQALGLADSFRLFAQPEKTFSWWDYRQLAFPKNPRPPPRPPSRRSTMSRW